MQTQLQHRPEARSREGAKRASPGAAFYGAPPGSLTADIVAVFTLTISSVGFAISLAALVFGGVLDAGLSRAVGSFVVGSGVMAVLVARRSHIVPVATLVQDGPAILMATVATGFVVSEGAEVADVFVLLVVTMLATSLATGLLGHIGLGELGRYLPTSVVGAFVGGTGWLLFKGGLDVMTNSPLGLADLGGLFGFDVAKFWAPGVVIGLFAWLAGRSRRVPGYVLGLIICACLAGFYVMVALVSSVSAVESGGWLLGPFPETGGTWFVTPKEFRTANWSGIANTAPGIASVVGLACISQLFSLAGIRAELVPRLNIDDELRTCARANLAASLFGVTPGFQGLGYTVLLHRLGATRRAVPLVAGGLVVVFGMVGVAAIGYVPRLIIGALLVMIGVGLLDDWLSGLMRSTSGAEQLFGVAIVGAVAWFGLLQGIGIGVVASGVVFVVRYSPVDPVRSAINGRQLRSGVDRSPYDVERLLAAGDRLMVFELQGFLFFGSVSTLEGRVREMTLGPDAVQTLVVDFAHVTGVDSSGCAVVARLLQELRREGIVVWVSALAPALGEALLVSEPGLATRVAFSHSLDAALESVEDELLACSAALVASSASLLPRSCRRSV